MGSSGAQLVCALALASSAILPSPVSGNAGVATRQSGVDLGDIAQDGEHSPPADFTSTSTSSSGVSVDSISSESDGQAPGGSSTGNSTASSGASWMSDYILSRVVKFWHGVAVDAAKEDYANEGAEPEANGPCYASRISAMVHVAMYDAYAGVTKEGELYGSYSQDPPAAADEEESYTYFFVYRRNGRTKTEKRTGKGRSLKSQLKEIRLAYSAVAQAAYEVLADGYPRQELLLKSALDKYFRSFFKLQEGKDWGSHVAATVLADRANDGYDAEPMFTEFPPDATYSLWEHRPDPTITPTQPRYAIHWGDVQPWGFTQMDGKVKAMPSPHKEDYTKEYNDVKDIGAKGPDTTRTEDQTHTALEWAYDGSYKIGTPIRMFNQVIDAMVDAAEKDSKYRRSMRSAYHLVKVYAATNVAMADAAISAWKEKYKHNFWRPIIGIRLGDTDGLSGTKGDPEWLPLGSPLTNTIKMSVTPAFPSYPSGHATIGTAGMKVAKLLMGVDDGFQFSWMSDEMNGKAKNADGSTRPRIVLKMTVEEAIEQNKVGRVYLGVHWHFDCERGTELGYDIAHKVADNFPKKA